MLGSRFKDTGWIVSQHVFRQTVFKEQTTETGYRNMSEINMIIVYSKIILFILLVCVDYFAMP